ncbi:hypothetical protein RIF29_27856 [Crotalaria pallida]|uniref:Uncharacterized protein n=1 Tax=Crotalaria pallida TaxID=3830 RepID=A0AAN9EPV0_CROPI
MRKRTSSPCQEEVTKKKEDIRGWKAKPILQRSELGEERFAKKKREMKGIWKMGLWIFFGIKKVSGFFGLTAMRLTMAVKFNEKQYSYTVFPEY